PRPPLPVDRAPAAERDPRGVGATSRGARRLARDGRRGVTPRDVARPHSPRRRAAALACELLRLACAGRLRRRTPPPELVDPPRARVLLRHGDPRLVAARPGPAATPAEWHPGRVRLRRVRPCRPARPVTGAPAACDLRLLRARTPPLGPDPARRPG